MGNCVVTAHWNPREDDWRIINKLKAVGQKYRVSVDIVNQGEYVQGKSFYSAEISGWWISWFGGQEICMEIVRKVGVEWRIVLEQNNVRGIDIRSEYLPM